MTKKKRISVVSLKNKQTDKNIEFEYVTFTDTILEIVGYHKDAVLLPIDELMEIERSDKCRNMARFKFEDNDFTIYQYENDHRVLFEFFRFVFNIHDTYKKVLNRFEQDFDRIY
jgi:hypothetical protein